MPAEIVSTRIHAPTAQEVITIMDDFGTVSVLQIPVADSAHRAGRIAEALAKHSAGETAIKTYARVNGIDITAQLEEGNVQRAAHSR